MILNLRTWLFICLFSFCFENTLAVECQQASPITSTVVYKINGMENIRPKRLNYKTVDGEQVSLDIYQPQNLKPNEKRGVVIFSNYNRKGIPDWMFYKSWCQLLAASGLHAVVYQSVEKPEEDLNEVISFVRREAAHLQINNEKVGVFCMSGNTVPAMPTITDSKNTFIKCSVIYYGMISFGPNPWIPIVRENLPLHIVRAGLDPSKELNDQLENYVKFLVQKNSPVSFVNYPTGHHAFDMVDENQRSREVIQDTIQFLIRHLN